MTRDETDDMADGTLNSDPLADAEPMALDPDTVEAMRRRLALLRDEALTINHALGSVAPAVTPPTLADARDAFLARLKPADGERVYFPWPGGQTEMPDRLGTIAKGALVPLPEGYEPQPWTDLWRRIGPLWPDRLAVLVGATGRGKSGFALCVAEAVARAGHPVLYLSAEMGTDELVARLLALRAQGDDDDHRNGVPYIGIMAGKADPDDVADACTALVADCPHLYLWAPQAEHRTPKALEDMTRAVVKAAGGRPPLVVVDYLQRMADGDDVRQAVRDVSGKLRDLSRPGKDWPGAAVLALSSTARGNYEYFASVKALRDAVGGPWKSDKDGKPYRAPPVPMEGLGKESGELETDAALLLVMTTDAGDETDAARDALVVVAKNRHGPKGTVPMTFWPASGSFVEAPETPKQDSFPRRGK